MSLDMECRGCPLCLGRRNVVAPEGPRDARVVLVGEAPGEREDETGRPFVGRAGGILDRAMATAGVDRRVVLVTNAAKCRPPGNRRPTAEELAACRPALLEDLGRADLVVALGASALTAITGGKEEVGKVANVERTIEIGGRSVTLLPTYHPAACIYSRKAREELAASMRRVAALL
jgi:DNA polymerase